jgi:hypothetical protein
MNGQAWALGPTGCSHTDFLGGGGVVVATQRPRSGIDRPDARIIAHAFVSKSLDSDYQQNRRGGDIRAQRG